MKLKDWLENHGWTQTAFAECIGLKERHYFNRIVNCKAIPSPNLALKIQKITNNEVTALELLYPKRKHEAM